MSWVWFGIGVAALIAFAVWILGSFKRWGPTDSERHSFFWGRRGGGDL